LKVRGFII